MFYSLERNKGQVELPRVVSGLCLYLEKEVSTGWTRALWTDLARDGKKAFRTFSNTTPKRDSGFWEARKLQSNQCREDLSE